MAKNEINIKLVAEEIVGNKDFQALITNTITNAMVSNSSKTEQKNSNKKNSDKSSEKKERVVTHSYQEKSRLISQMTNKDKSKYVSKEELLSGKFPMDYHKTLELFRDLEIGGRPWISYEEQLKEFINPLSGYYKLNKGEKKNIYKDLQIFLMDRVKATESNEKLADYQKKHRILSLELAFKEVGECLGDL